MGSEKPTKTLVQCDFDGTITEKDVSFMLLNTFAGGDWKPIHKKYEEGKISVGRFNSEAFALIKADRQTLLNAIDGRVKIRAGFREFVASCRKKGFRLVIVSNGLDFYIEDILNKIGVAGIDVFAAKTEFYPEGLKVQYIGPDGSPVDKDFKGAYVNSFLSEGYRIVYIGNGVSDISPATRCHYVCATSDMLAGFKQANLDCVPFTDFFEVVKAIEHMP